MSALFTPIHRCLIELKYLLPIQTSSIGFYAYVAFACDVKPACLDLLYLSCIRIGSNDVFYLIGSNLRLFVSTR